MNKNYLYLFRKALSAKSDADGQNPERRFLRNPGMRPRYEALILALAAILIAGAAFFLTKADFSVARLFIFSGKTSESGQDALTSAADSAIKPVTGAESAAQTENEAEKADKFKYLGWWGEINYNKAGVYENPTRDSKRLGTFSKINRVKVLEEVSGELVGENSLWYKIDGGAFPGAYVFSNDVTPIGEPKPPVKPEIPKEAKAGEYWIDVDITKQVLTLFMYDKPVFATYVSTGRPGNPTVKGAFRIYLKLSKTRMRGGPPLVSYSYNLPNVPYTMYYFKGYGIHGTYWHDKFGARQSAGCTNLTQGDAKYIFNLVNPKLGEGESSVRSSTDNTGTIIYNHY